jgi:hypothetical protein
MAQRYPAGICHERMAADACPECGKPAEQHSSSLYFWERGFGQCDLLPAGVRERIDQYRTDTAAGAMP